MSSHCHKISTLSLLCVLGCISSCSKQSQEGQHEIKQQVEGKPPNPIANEVASREFTPVERQIHDYIQTIGDDYQNKFGIEKGEALVSVATSKEFKRTIVEVCRIYDLIENAKSGSDLTDAEIDALNMRRFKDIGFVERDGTWYFDNQEVNMGNPLPTPESMKPKQPEEGKKLEVTMEAEVVVSDLKTLQIKGKTNLPDETELMIHISCPAMDYSAGDKAVVLNGQFESGPFSDSRRPLNRLGDGRYLLEIITPTVNVLNETAKIVLGEGGKNMAGKLIKFDEVFGKSVSYSKMVIVQ
jgi:hypothetical protein